MIVKNIKIPDSKNTKSHKNIVLQSKLNRVFVNLSNYGCGSGCVYCYVDRYNDPQSLLNRDKILSSLAQLVDNDGFKPGKHGTLVSLCPDTEPFKTRSSIKLTLSVLDFIMPLGNPIQISTKEEIPVYVLESINKIQLYPGQVVVFTAVSTISKAHVIEPYAASPSARFRNFIECKKYDLFSCIYIKPFLSNVTFKDIELFIEAIDFYRPQSACVGIYYSGSENTNTITRHPVHKNLGSSGPSEKLFEFSARIRTDASTLTFYSSSCVSAYSRDWYTGSLIWRKLPRLCVECRNCESDYLKNVGI